MKAEYINPFLKATKNVIMQMTNIEMTLTKTEIKQDLIMNKEVGIFLGITGDLQGNVFFHLDEIFAKEIASKMMGGIDVKEFNELTKSAVSELSNIIMGNVCTLFSQQEILINISPPTLITGSNVDISVTYKPLLSAKLRYMDNEIEMDIAIRDN